MEHWILFQELSFGWKISWHIWQVFVYLVEKKQKKFII